MSNARTGLEIAIIGMAGRFPGAGDLCCFWRNLRAGLETLSTFSDQELTESGVSAELLTDPTYVRSRGALAGAELFDASFFGYYPREAQILDPQQRLFLECAWEALENAGCDPMEHNRCIGVFAGAGTTDYLALLANDPDICAAVDEFQLAYANEKDFLATRVSYKLGLEGPSLTVQTGCSTSLVATHLACLSLLSGECQVALAGGVSVRVPQRVGYRPVKGGILSPDGHCRAFDARAEGTVTADGVGVVVLKRLEDALIARDNICAVIRGSAVNNDGDRKIGFTAPSALGQARCVRAAHLLAEVDPETITYVEAHGTATLLGDPVEVAGLTQAFRGATDKRGFCALGSVKTNIGHTDAAAGIAGLIKTVLSLEHRELPPTLHFERPNPEIRFEDTPFYVNASLQRWGNEETILRAGVNSTGIGGTNVHVILEQAPALPRCSPSRRHQLLVLSAKTPAALQRATLALAAHLKNHPDHQLPEIAYTLHVGRRAFDCRRAFLVENIEEAVAALEGRLPQRAIKDIPNAANRSVVFMFPGGGSQHSDMASALYFEEPNFREQFDICAELLGPHLGLDIRAVLPSSGKGDIDERVNSPTLFPAALFALEYALAHLWMSWGVKPQALIGHSLGEYVAACVAGVLSLEDALALIALRGRLFERMPAGAMLAAQIPVRELEQILVPPLAIAAINGPRSCVVSGPLEAIEVLSRRLTEQQIDSSRLQVPIAAHSPAVAEIAEEFERFVGSCRLHPPQLPIISNVTGTWLRPEEATSAQYWARQLRNTVRFSDGVIELLRTGADLFLEVGPGRALSAAVRSHVFAGWKPLALTSLSSFGEEESDNARIMTSLGQLWLAGAEIDWRSFYNGQIRRRIPLPTYPFEKEHYWANLTSAGHRGRPLEAWSGAGCQLAGFARLGRVGGPVEPVGTKHEHGPDAEPLSQTQSQILEIWKHAFGMTHILLDDDFFDLGGHSLLATRLLHLLSSRFGVQLLHKDLLRDPTVAGLANTIESALGIRESLDQRVFDVAHEVHLDATITPRKPGRVAPEPRQILLTGSTGYLGTYLLHELLHQTTAKIYCLVRGGTAGNDPAKRIAENLVRYGLCDGLPGDRITPVVGDLGQLRFGLSERDFIDLGHRVHAIYHCAATVHFTDPYSHLKAANVIGTEEILRLAVTGSLKPVHHMSTTAVFPPSHESGIEITEADHLPRAEELGTGYAQSKWVAEQLIGLARARGVPVAIYRPGAITGDSRTDICRSEDAIWRMIKGCIQLKEAPETDSELVSAPVDYVSRAVVHIASQQESLGRNFHLTGPGTMPWRSIFKVVRQLGYRLHPASYSDWVRRLRGVTDQDNALFPLSHLFDPDRPELPNKFDCRNTIEALIGSDIHCAPLDSERLRRYLVCLTLSGFLPQPPKKALVAPAYV